MKPSWTKITHVKSSLEAKSNQYAMFIGRWQPLHDGHRELFNQALNEGKNVCIAIRDVATDFNNPYTAAQVFMNLTKEFSSFIKQNRMKIVVIPDISSVEFGRGVGYDIIEHIPPTEIAEISATKIREQIRQKELSKNDKTKRP